jgi:hypothetical protein
MAKRLTDRDFMKVFREKVFDFVGTYLEVEELAKAEARGDKRPKLADKQIQELVDRWAQQRTAVNEMYDRAKGIAERIHVYQRFRDLLKPHPGEHSEWGQLIHLDDDLPRSLEDTFVRIDAVLADSPRGIRRLQSASKRGWEWLDKRSRAKWIVASGLVIVALGLLKALGYDLHGLIQLVKAIRGDK